MKTIFTIATAAFLISGVAFPSVAAIEKKVDAKLEKSCKDQAAKKYSAVHFLKRRDFVKKCAGNT